MRNRDLLTIVCIYLRGRACVWGKLCVSIKRTWLSARVRICMFFCNCIYHGTAVATSSASSFECTCLPCHLLWDYVYFEGIYHVACMHVRDARLKLTHPGDASRAGVLPRADPPPVPLIMGLLSRLRVPVSFEGTPSKPPLPLPLPLEVIFRRSASRRVVMRPYHLCYK